MLTFSQLVERYDFPLIERNIGGIHVAMFYDRRTESVFVFYSDCKTGTEFVLDPPKFLAVDAYTHPVFYADAALNGKSNPRSLVPAGMER